MVRANNEDSFYVSNEPIGLMPNLYVIADGMGGHLAGEVASGKAIEFMIRYLESSPNGESDLSAIIAEGTILANKGVFALANQNPELLGMGTTFSAVTIDGLELICAHVGDSRVYVADGSGINQLTNDHTYVGEMQRKGELTVEQARTHPRRNLLTRALGTDSWVDIDVFKRQLKPGDTVVLCSDGLFGCITDEKIWELVSDPLLDPAAKAGNLVNAANARGGMDNISVIVILVD